MELNSNKNWFNRVISVSLVLTTVSTFIVIIIGSSLKNIHEEIVGLNTFLAASQDIQTNFEESLQAYTENTSEIITYLSDIRPEGEREYIAFINQVEKVGKELNLNLDFRSIDEPDKKKIIKNYLAYTISFYGTQDDLINFIEKIEDMPYFVKIFDLDFKDPSFATESDRSDEHPNVTLKIRLFIK